MTLSSDLHPKDAELRRCEQCGAKLTDQEIQTAVDAGGPFLCAVHATEIQPALALEDEADQAP